MLNHATCQKLQKQTLKRGKVASEVSNCRSENRQANKYIVIVSQIKETFTSEQFLLA
jgi:hypothetical protein